MGGLVAIAAPAIVRPTSIMPVRSLPVVIKSPWIMYDEFNCEWAVPGAEINHNSEADMYWRHQTMIESFKFIANPTSCTKFLMAAAGRKNALSVRKDI
jgi:hypothetical protein